MQGLFMIQIVHWDYNDHHAPIESDDYGCTDSLQGLLHNDRETLVQRIIERGAPRRVYQIIETYHT